MTAPAISLAPPAGGELRRVNMPALSIRQPWAWLIVHGFKDVENRAWYTPLRGAFLVHAGKTFSRAYFADQRRELALAGLLPDGFPSFEELERQCGGIVGQARIVDCVSPSSSPWFIPGGWAFQLADARPLPFTPLAGRLQFFDVRVSVNA